MIREFLPLLKIETVEKKGNYTRFAFEPLPAGFGHTLGNALRRVLLSSLPGAAVIQFKIEGINHQFSAIDGVREDVVEFSLNVKKIRLKIFDENPITLKISARGPKEVKAGDLEVLGNGEIVNKDLHLCSLADGKAKIDLEMAAERGVGYQASEEKETTKIGIIPVDSIFTPVTAVAYKVEATRLGRRMGLDRLTLEITTDGTLTPYEALNEASLILVDYFRVVSGEKIEGEKEAKEERKSESWLSPEERKTSVEDLGLATRTANAVLRGKIETLGDLAGAKTEELSRIRGLGKKGLSEIETLLEKLKKQ